jgi:TPR repeat protein
MFTLAKMLEAGYGCTPDADQAEQWLARAKEAFGDCISHGD